MAELESTEHAGARVGKPGLLTSRNLPSGSEPHPGQDRRGASESRERRSRTLSLTRGTYRRVRGTKAPPTSGAQRLARVCPHLYWWSCGACVMCGARVRSVPGRCLSEEKGVARAGIRAWRYTAGDGGSEASRGEPGLTPAQWDAISESPGPMWGSRGAVRSSLLRHLFPKPREPARVTLRVAHWSCQLCSDAS